MVFPEARVNRKYISFCHVASHTDFLIIHSCLRDFVRHSYYSKNINPIYHSSFREHYHAVCLLNIDDEFVQIRAKPLSGRGPIFPTQCSCCRMMINTAEMGLSNIIPPFCTVPDIHINCRNRD